MRPIVRWALVFALLFPAAADATFLYQSDVRLTESRCASGQAEVTRPSPPFSDFATGGINQGGLVNQTSSLRDEAMTLYGLARVMVPETCPGRLEVLSHFEIRFSVTEDAAYRGLGEAMWAHLERPPIGGEDADVLFDVGNPSRGEVVPVDVSGFLRAGETYILVARARASTFADGIDIGSFDMTFSLVPVPEPSSAVLLVAGGMVLAARAGARAR